MNVKYNMIVHSLGQWIAEVGELDGTKTVLLVKDFKPSSKTSIDSKDFITFIGYDITEFINTNVIEVNPTQYNQRLTKLIEDSDALEFTYSMNTKYRLIKKI